MLLFVEAGRRLVEQQEAGPSRECARHLDPPPRAVRKPAARLHRDIGDAQTFRGGQRDPARVFQPAVAADRADRLQQSTAIDAGAGHRDIVEHGEIVDQMDMLKRARNPEPRIA